MFRRLLLALLLTCFAQAGFAAAYTYRATGSVAQNSDSAELAPGAPVGKATGDLLLFFTGTYGVSDNAGVANYTAIFEDNDATTPSLEVWCRIADGSADDTPTVDWTGTVDSFAWIAAYHGDVHTNCADIVAHSNFQSTGSTTSLPLTTLTITTDDTLVVGFSVLRKTPTSNDATLISHAVLTKLTQLIQTGTAVFAAVGDLQQTTATDYAGDNFTRDGTAEGAAQNGANVVLSLKTAAAAAPTWDSNSVVASQTTSAFTANYDADANATNIFGAIFPLGTTEQTGATIEAGTGAHGTCTEATTGSADSIVCTATDSPASPAYELQFVLKGAGGYSTVISLPDEFLDPPAGKQFTTLASVDANSHCDGQTPPIVAGDITVYDTQTNGTGYAITPFDTCLIQIASGGDDSRQEYELNVYDVSLAAYYGEATFATNNGSPFVIDEWPLEVALYELNTNPAFDADDWISDPELDPLTWAYTSGTQPTDWVLGASDGTITDGTPGACGVYTFEITGTDTYRATKVVPGTVIIGPRVPEVANSDAAAAEAAIEGTGAAQGCTLTATAGTPAYSATVAEGNVISTDPAAGTLVVPDQAVTYQLSLGESPGGQRRKLNLGLGIDMSVVFEPTNAINDDYWDTKIAA